MSSEKGVKHFHKMTALLYATQKGLLFLTWDEDDYSAANHIATIAVGPMVIPGRYSQKISHYSVLRTTTDLFGLPALNNAAPINGPLR